MSTLFIRMVPQLYAASASHWPSLRLPFALVSQGGSIERQGMSPLTDLADALAKAERTILLLAGSDVTILRMEVPPLPQSKLKAALPNLVEERILADQSDCIVVAGASLDGLRTIAVARRAWLNSLATTLAAFGARRIEALPSPLCLPLADDPGSVAAAIEVHGDANDAPGIGLTIRFREQDAVGLEIVPEKHETATQAALRTLDIMVPTSGVDLYVPELLVSDCRSTIEGMAPANRRFRVVPDDWAPWIAGAQAVELDLMSALAARRGPWIDWRAWRWPLAMAVAVLATNVIALNVDWWHMKHEANSLRASMIQMYRSAYPRDSVIVDPIAQIQQKIAISRHKSGLPEPDDFTLIAAAFADAWNGTIQGQAPAGAIAGVDYHDRGLYVTLKSGSKISVEPVKDALAKRGLTLQASEGQPGVAVWQIRSAK